MLPKLTAAWLDAGAAIAVPDAEARLDVAATGSNTDVATAATEVTTAAIAAAAKFTPEDNVAAALDQAAAAI